MNMINDGSAWGICKASVAAGYIYIERDSEGHIGNVTNKGG